MTEHDEIDELLAEQRKRLLEDLRRPYPSRDWRSRDWRLAPWIIVASLVASVIGGIIARLIH